jgi:hypothetical protein
MRTTAIAGIVLMTAGIGLGAQDQLRAAKDLYASAAYEDALATLSRIDSSASAPETAREVEQYRAFSLYALGRTREAESVAEAMIRKDPLARLDSVDASPRLVKMFEDVRARLLPGLIRERFKTARTALDQKIYDTAQPLLIEARLMIAEAEKLALKDDGLGDLSTLIDGFLQLIRLESEKQVSAAAAPAGAAAAAGDAADPVRAAAPPPAAPVPAARSGAPPPSTPPPSKPASAAPASRSPAPANANGPRV